MLRSNFVSFAARFVLLVLLTGASGLVVHAQMAQQYRNAAQAYRDAAAKTRSAKNRSCYLANAQYYDCLAAQLGPNGPRSCQEASCQLEAEPGGGASGGSTAPVNQPTNDTRTDADRTSEQLRDIMNRRERQRQVEEEEAAEREDAANSKAHDMTPNGNDAIKGLVEGNERVDKLGSSDAEKREKLYGKSADEEKDDSPLSSSATELADELANKANNDESFTGPDGRAAQSADNQSAAFYREGDPQNGDLYSPFSNSKEAGWGVGARWKPPGDAADVPVSISFEKNGVTVETYAPSKAIPVSEDYSNGQHTIEYAPDANHPQGTTVTFRNGRVVDVKGPVDDRVPTVVTYNREGVVTKVEHGPSAPANPSGQALQPGQTTSPLPQAKPSQTPSTSNNKSEEAARSTFITPPKSSKEAQADEPEGEIDGRSRIRVWIDEKKKQFNEAKDSAKQWWNEHVTQPIATARRCFADVSSCVMDFKEDDN